MDLVYISQLGIDTYIGVHDWEQRLRLLAVLREAGLNISFYHFRPNRQGFSPFLLSADHRRCSLYQ